MDLRLIAGLASACVCALLLSCAHELKDSTELITEYKLDEASTVEIEIFEEGYLRMRILAPSLVHRVTTTGRIIEFPDGFNAYMFNDSGALSGYLSADHGTLLPEYRQVIVRHNVVFLNEKGERLDAYELIIDAEKQKIYTHNRVKFRTKDGTIIGDGFESDLSLKRYRIFKPKGELPLKEINL